MNSRIDPENLLDIGNMIHQSVGGVGDGHEWFERSGSCLPLCVGPPYPAASCTTKVVVGVTSPKAQSPERGLTPMDQSAHPGSQPAGSTGPDCFLGWVGGTLAHIGA